MAPGIRAKTPTVCQIGPATRPLTAHGHVAVAVAVAVHDHVNAHAVEV
jgi:hypothetical protein